MKRLCEFSVFTVLVLLSATQLSASEPVGKRLKVFVLAGQSNMQGHAQVKTFDAMRLNPATAPLLAKMRDADGAPHVCKDVWISSIGSADKEQTGQLTVGFGAQAATAKIGPEFTFGITMAEIVEEPILIIKTAWGGKSLNTDFRPPGAKPYEFNESQLRQFEKQNKDVAEMRAEKEEASGVYYRLMIEHVKAVLADIDRVYPDYDENQGYELAGFVWFQGWNDMVDGSTYPSRDQPGGYDQYSDLLAHFIRDVRTDLAAPELPFVIGVMGAGGPTDQYGPSQQRYKAVHQNFRDAMAAPADLPGFKGNVVAVLTENFWDMEVVRLREREQKIKPEVNEVSAAIKSGEMPDEEGRASIEKLYADTFDQRELEILRDSVSNAEYHYLGSAGIMAQIGKAFAEALGKVTAELN